MATKTKPFQYPREIPASRKAWHNIFKKVATLKVGQTVLVHNETDHDHTSWVAYTAIHVKRYFRLELEVQGLCLSVRKDSKHPESCRIGVYTFAQREGQKVKEAKERAALRKKAPVRKKKAKKKAPRARKGISPPKGA